MAIIAMSHFAMGTVVPGDILGRHEVTIDAGLRIVREVRYGVAQLKDVEAQANDHACQHRSGWPPTLGRDKAVAKQKTLEVGKAGHRFRRFSGKYNDSLAKKQDDERHLDG
jgi:hypothetical protein